VSIVKADIINQNTDDEAKKIMERLGQQEGNEQTLFQLLGQIEANTGFQSNFGKVKVAGIKATSRPAVFRLDGARKIVGIGITWSNTTISGTVKAVTLDIDDTVYSVISGEQKMSFPVRFMFDFFNPTIDKGALLTTPREANVYSLKSESEGYFEKSELTTFECKKHIEIKIEFAKDSSFYNMQANVLYID